MPILCAWSLFYFALLLPSVGVAIFRAQRMLKDAVHFLIIYFILLIPFQQAFQRFMNTYSKQGCIKDFSNDIKSLFTLYLTTFFVVDPREFEVEHEIIFILLFVLFTFVSAIVLLDFLIAIMSNTAQRLSMDNDVILQLNRLNVAAVIESRFGWVHAFYWPIKRWFFVVDQVKGKMFVVTSESRLE